MAETNGLIIEKKEAFDQCTFIAMGDVTHALSVWAVGLGYTNESETENGTLGQ